MGAVLGSLHFFWYSSRRSILLPTKILGADGTHSSSYGNHYIEHTDTFFLAFKKEGGSMTEKHIIKTSQWGYARGLNRLYYYCPAVSLAVKHNSTTGLGLLFCCRFWEWWRNCRIRLARSRSGICSRCSWVLGHGLPHQDARFAHAAVTYDHQLYGDWLLWHCLPIYYTPKHISPIPIHPFICIKSQ